MTADILTGNPSDLTGAGDILAGVEKMPKGGPTRGHRGGGRLPGQ